MDWKQRGLEDGLKTIKTHPEIFADMLERNELLPSDAAYQFYLGLLEAKKQYEDSQK